MDKDELHLFESQLRRLVREADDKTTWARSSVFIDGVYSALERYRKSAHLANETARSTIESFRDIFLLFSEESPDFPKIRNRLLSLPEMGREELIRRARWRCRALVDADSVSWLKFRRWVLLCRDESLFESIPALISTGRTLSYGQLRKSGLRSRPHIEPVVFGWIRRLQRPDIDWYQSPAPPQGGRPIGRPVYDLLTEIGILWVEVTGAPAEAKRGHFTPFPKAALIILEAAGIKSAEKRQAILNLFLRSIRAHRSRKTNVPFD